MFLKPPIVEFRPAIKHCPCCGDDLKVQKTRTRKVSTLHVGIFRAKEVFLECKSCGHISRCENLRRLVPPGSNFGYDVIVYAGKALFLRHRTEEEVVAELAERNVHISPREVSLLGMKFVVYLAIAHQQITPGITADMQNRGGYILHLDATCEGGAPFLMSTIDSLSEIVLGNIKLPSEAAEYIVPFLERIKNTYGLPLALVHDMGKGIANAIAKVFPDVLDFICHFHFLRDIGKDFFGAEYDTIRKRLSKHGISKKLRYRAGQLKSHIDQRPELIKAFETGIDDASLPTDSYQYLPVLNAYMLIKWTLKGKSQGNGYGFPFDYPFLVFAKRIRLFHEKIEELKSIRLRGESKDNKPYHKIFAILDKVMDDKTLWKAIKSIEEKISIFEKLRSAMRIASKSSLRGLNDEGQNCRIQTIEKCVKKFCDWLTGSKGYSENNDAKKMIEQINKYWEKLFADPIVVQTPSGPVSIQPQRTNNLLEQFFRRLKRADRRKTGNASSRRMLQAILAETPLVQNLENPTYMKILLEDKKSLDELFAEIEIETLRNAFREAQNHPQKISPKLKRIIDMKDLPDKLVNMVKKAVA